MPRPDTRGVVTVGRLDRRHVQTHAANGALTLGDLRAVVVAADGLADSATVLLEGIKRLSDRPAYSTARHLRVEYDRTGNV